MRNNSSTTCSLLRKKSGLRNERNNKGVGGHGLLSIVVVICICGFKLYVEIGWIVNVDQLSSLMMMRRRRMMTFDFEMHWTVVDVILMLIVDDIDDVNAMDYDYVELVMVMKVEELIVDLKELL
jgi:hypothetical protein